MPNRCASCDIPIRDAWIYYNKEVGKLEVCNRCYIKLRNKEG